MTAKGGWWDGSEWRRSRTPLAQVSARGNHNTNTKGNGNRGVAGIKADIEAFLARETLAVEFYKEHAPFTSQRTHDQQLTGFVCRGTPSLETILADIERSRLLQIAQEVRF